MYIYIYIYYMYIIYMLSKFGKYLLISNSIFRYSKFTIIINIKLLLCFCCLFNFVIIIKTI